MDELLGRTKQCDGPGNDPGRRNRPARERTNGRQRTRSYDNDDGSDRMEITIPALGIHTLKVCHAASGGKAMLAGSQGGVLGTASSHVASAELSTLGAGSERRA
jgi:hypothetical protein